MTSFKYCFSLILALSLTCCNQQSEVPESTSSHDSAAAQSSEATSRTSEETVIVFFGDSITAGYGIDPDDAFPALVEQALESEGYTVKVRNAGVSGETTAGGLRRIDWILNQDVDILVVELGGNDGLRGVPVTETKRNLRQIISRARTEHPDIEVVVAGMQLPPNLGTTYTSEFAKIFGDVAESENVALIPFILEGVGGIRGLNQPDGVHPTEEGHEVIAKTVLPVLKPIVRQVSSR